MGVTTMVCAGRSSVPVPFAENVAWPVTSVCGIIVGGLGSVAEVGPLSGIVACVACAAVTVAAIVIESTPARALLTCDGSVTELIVNPKTIGWFTGHEDS